VLRLSAEATKAAALVHIGVGLSNREVVAVDFLLEEFERSLGHELVDGMAQRVLENLVLPPILLLNRALDARSEVLSDEPLVRIHQLLQVGLLVMLIHEQGLSLFVTVLDCFLMGCHLLARAEVWLLEGPGGDRARCCCSLRHAHSECSLLSNIIL